MCYVLSRTEKEALSYLWVASRTVGKEVGQLKVISYIFFLESILAYIEIGGGYGELSVTTARLLCSVFKILLLLRYLL